MQKKPNERISKGHLRKELDRRVSNLRERFGKLENDPSNDELIDVIIEPRKDLTRDGLLEKTAKPFCLECLSSTKSFFPMMFIQDSDEYCCPNCGITTPKISADSSQLTEKLEETRRRESFCNEAKNKESYIEMERLLTKYEKKAPRKRKIVKKRKTVK